MKAEVASVRCAEALPIGQRYCCCLLRSSLTLVLEFWAIQPHRLANCDSEARPTVSVRSAIAHPAQLKFTNCLTAQACKAAINTT